MPERIRQPASTLRSLQAGRAVAALLVVLFHASGSICAAPKYFDSRPFGRIFDFGYAGALSVVLLIVMLAFTWAYLRITKGIEEPE